jgi:polysaccharide pyruvyl transferase WcaK-like protein
MQRREAIALFREISKRIPDAFISCISLSPSKLSKKEFELKMNMALDGRNLKTVQSLVKQYGLRLKEDKGFLVIYGSETKPLQMPIVT